MKYGLSSPHWRQGRKCKACGKGKKLTRHHVSKYKRIVLCRGHHAIVHRLANLEPMVLMRVIFYSIIYRLNRHSLKGERKNE